LRQPTTGSVGLSSVLDARSTVGVLLAPGLAAADTGVHVARSVADTLRVRRAVVTVDERVQRATGNDSRSGSHGPRAIIRASAENVEVRDVVGSGTVTGGAVHASTLLGNNVARLGLTTASVDGLAGILVPGGALAALGAADSLQERRRGQVPRGDHSREVPTGNGCAPAENLGEAAFHFRPAKELAWLEWLGRIVEGEGLGDRHEGDDAGDKSNSHSE